jgi:hypothetical protein
MSSLLNSPFNIYSRFSYGCGHTTCPINRSISASPFNAFFIGSQRSTCRQTPSIFPSICLKDPQVCTMRNLLHLSRLLHLLHTILPSFIFLPQLTHFILSILSPSNKSLLMIPSDTRYFVTKFNIARFVFKFSKSMNN